MFKISNSFVISTLILTFSHGRLLHAESIDDLYSMDIAELIQVSITTATKTPNTLISAPSSARVFQQEDIKRLGVFNLQELVNLVSGWQSTRVAGSSNRYSIANRGKSTGVEILVLLNGARLNTLFPLYTTLSKIPLDFVSRVEFINGPTSSIYGSNAFMGTINIITDTAPKTVGLALSNHAGKRVAVSGSQQQDNFSSSFFYVQNEWEGALYNIAPYDTSTRDPLKEQSLFVDAHYKGFSTELYYANDIAWDFTLSDKIGNGINREEKEQGYVKFNFLGKALADSPFELEVKKSFAKRNLRVKALTEGSLSEISAPSSDSALISNALISEKELMLGYTQWLYQDDITWLWGAEYRTPEITQANVKSNFDLFSLDQGLYPIGSAYGLDFSMPIAELEQQEYIATFIQAEARVNHRFNTVFGARYDKVETTDNLSLRASLVYKLDTRRSLKAIYGEAFRTPNLSETNIINQSRVTSNPNLKPEDVKTIELSWYQESMTENSLLVFSGYYSEIGNTINRVLSGTDSVVYRFENGTKETLSGLELLFERQWSNRLSTRFGSACVLTSAQSVRRLSDCSSTFEISHSRGQLSSSLYVYHRSTKQDVISDGRRISLPESLVSGLSINYEIEPGLQLLYKIKNLNNGDDYGLSETGLVTEGVPGLMRAHYFQISYKYN
jgi:iron complex outermembrane receptor protein